MSILKITCPNCNHSFEATQGLKEELNQQAKEWQRKREEEFKQKENAFFQQLNQKEIEFNNLLQKEKITWQQQEKEQIVKSLSIDFELKLKQLQESDAEKTEKLKTAQLKELEYLKKERELEDKKAELELEVQKKLNIERQALKEQLILEQQERNILKEQEYTLKTKELEKQIADNKKLIDEMKRKAEQGSMQLQGEIQEIELENLLKDSFPFDKVEEVGKGVRGADCIQVVHTRMGAEAGKIIYESKRTKEFSNEWIEKLKTDMRSLGADVAVLVTQTMPKDLESFGEKDGIYICRLNEVKSVAALLRNAIIKVYDVKKSQHNQGDKMALLYEYLVGNEFGEQWKAIREGFMSMKMSIQKERDMMEKIWKAREKQLEKVLLNATHIRGSIEGIAGLDSINLNMIENEDGLLLD